MAGTAATLWFVSAVAGAGLWARLSPGGSRVRQFLITGIVGGAGLATGLALRTPRADAADWLAEAAAYAFACELYVFLFTFVGSSVSVALLVERLETAPPRRPVETLDPVAMVECRLATMHNAGVLEATPPAYRLNNRSRLILRVYRALRRLFRHETST